MCNMGPRSCEWEFRCRSLQLYQAVNHIGGKNHFCSFKLFYYKIEPSGFPSVMTWEIFTVNKKSNHHISENYMCTNVIF